MTADAKPADTEPGTETTLAVALDGPHQLEVTSVDIVGADPDVAHSLGVPLGTSVLLLRLRSTARPTGR